MSKTDKDIYEDLGFPETRYSILEAMKAAREDERKKIRNMITDRLQVLKNLPEANTFRETAYLIALQNEIK
jgi:hypothetical protein